MTETPNRGSAAGVLLGTSATLLYTSLGAGTWSILRGLPISNTDVQGHWVTLGINNALTDTAAARILAPPIWVPPRKKINALEDAEVDVLLGHATTPDLIYGLCDTASVVTARVSVIEGP